MYYNISYYNILLSYAGRYLYYSIHNIYNRNDSFPWHSRGAGEASLHTPLVHTQNKYYYYNII